MSSKKFWKLSLYEWSIWLLRIKSQQERRRQDIELRVELERTHMELLAAAQGIKKLDGNSFSKYDFFWTLSYDTIPDPVIKLSDEETMQKVKQRFRKYIK
jgi:hypothetical protein